MKALLSATTVGFSFIVAGFAWFYAGAVRCDDACSLTATSWAASWDSWQWSLIMWLGVALLVFAAATAILAWRDRYTLATTTVVLWTAAATLMCDLITSASAKVGLDLWLWLALGLVLTGGCAATARPTARAAT